MASNRELAIAVLTNLRAKVAETELSDALEKWRLLSTVIIMRDVPVLHRVWIQTEPESLWMG